MKKFVVDELYYAPGLYGPSYIVECVGRTETTITLHEIDYPDSDPYTKDIVIQGDTETCLAWEYKGHTAYICAGEEE